jgi:hypothetical protein
MVLYFTKAFRFTFRTITVIPFLCQQNTNIGKLNTLHKPGSYLALFYKSLSIPNIEKVSATKKGNIDGTMGSKSKMKGMKSYKNIKKEATPKKTKKENALDIISKSLQKNRNKNYLNGSGSILINL